MYLATNIYVKKLPPLLAGSATMTKFSWPALGVFVGGAVLCSALAQAQGLRASPNLSVARIGAPGDTVQRSADYIVAIVNSEPITNIELRNRVLRFEQQLSQRGGALPPRQEISAQMLERLIGERAQVQLARENGIKIEEAALNAAVLNVARQNQMGVDELRTRLQAEGVSFNQFRDGLRDEMLLTRVREREVEGRLTVSESELDQFVREQQGSEGAPVLEIALAQILVAVPENATPAQLQALQTRAQRAAQRVRGGEDFAKVAREMSEAPDSAAGGMMGLRAVDRYPSLFVEATSALSKGGIAGPVRSGAGFHVLQLVEKKQSGASNITITQSRARHILLRTNAQMSESAATARLAQLRRSITGGQLDFAAAARDNSQDGSAKEGGDLGWANPGQFVPEFEEVMNSLAPGQVSQPLVSRFGVHLIQLQERRESTLSAREQRELARGTLREKKAEEAYATWAQDVRAKAYVELREPPQ
jgi:peptidyl-prolyl cis-trans isomerase SurA